MRLDQENIRQLHVKLQEHLDQFGKIHGFRINLGRASFTDKLAEFKVSVAPIQEDGSAASASLTVTPGSVARTLPAGRAKPHIESVPFASTSPP